MDSQSHATNAEVGHQPQNAGHSASSRTDLDTSTSGMASYATSLVSQRFISSSTNNEYYQIMTFRINATVLFNLFINILTPLVYSVARTLNLRPTDANYEASITAYAQALAQQACLAAHAVMYNKAARINGFYSTLFGNYPTVIQLNFPQFISALVSSIGPVTMGALPFRRTMVPYIVLQDIMALIQPPAPPNNIVPPRYSNLVKAFIETRTIATANVDVNTVSSSYWWTFHVFSTTTPGQEGVTYRTVYSPVGFSETENHLKLGMAFANDNLTELPGAAIHSLSVPFESNRIPRLFADIPAPAKAYPSFIRGYPAYYAYFMRLMSDGSLSDPKNPVFQPRSPGPPSANTRKRQRIDSQGRMSEIPDTDEADERSPTYQAFFLYYDHIAIDMVNIEDRNKISTQLHQLIN